MAGAGMRPGERRDDLARRLAGTVRVRQLRQHDHEFVPALAADGVRAPDAHRQFPGDDLQELVAHRVPERVVDLLEAVDVQKEHRHPAMMTSGQRECPGQPIREQHAVRETRQGVVAGEMGELPRRRVGMVPEMILAQQRFTEQLQEFSCPASRSVDTGDCLLARDHSSGKAVPLSRASRAIATDSRMLHEGVAGHQGPDHMPIERKGDADHRQARRPGDHDRGTTVAVRLREAFPGAGGKHTGIVAVRLERGDDRGGRYRPAHDLRRPCRRGRR